MIWDMGAIATVRGPAARDLFEQVMVASASLPGVLPPSMIKVAEVSRRFRRDACRRRDGKRVLRRAARPDGRSRSWAGAPGAFFHHRQGQPAQFVRRHPSQHRKDRSPRARYRPESGAEDAAACHRRIAACTIAPVPVASLSSGVKDDLLDFRLDHRVALFRRGHAVGGRRRRVDDPGRALRAGRHSSFVRPLSCGRRSFNAPRTQPPAPSMPAASLPAGAGSRSCHRPGAGCGCGSTTP